MGMKSEAIHILSIREKPVAAARKYDYRSARIFSLWRKARDRRPRDVVNVNPRLASYKIGWCSSQMSLAR
jgi:hypothetical protein